MNEDNFLARNHLLKEFPDPTAKLEVCGILEEDLTDLQKYIDYLTGIK